MSLPKQTLKLLQITWLNVFEVCRSEVWETLAIQFKAFKARGTLKTQDINKVQWNMLFVVVRDFWDSWNTSYFGIQVFWKQFVVTEYFN